MDSDRERNLEWKQMGGDQEPNPDSTPEVGIVEEIDFFDEQRPKEKTQVEEITFPGMLEPIVNSSSLERTRVLDTDHLELALGLSIVGGSTNRDPKRRKIVDDDFHVGFEGSSHENNNPNIISLFGRKTTISRTNGLIDVRKKGSKDEGKANKEAEALGLELTLSAGILDASTDNDERTRKIVDDFHMGFEDSSRRYGNSATIWIPGLKTSVTDDITDDQKMKRSKSKGKAKIMCDGNRDPEAFDRVNSRILIPRREESSAGINENKEEKKENSSTNRKESKTLILQREQQSPVAPTPPLDPGILEEIQQKGGSEPVHLFSKKLETSDVKTGLNRIFITRSQKLLDALTEDERRVVDSKEECFGVCVIDPQGEEYQMHLKKWHAAKMVVLKHAWNTFVLANKLQKGDTVHGWGYRQGEFRLAFTFVRKEQ